VTVVDAMLGNAAVAAGLALAALLNERSTAFTLGVARSTAVKSARRIAGWPWPRLAFQTMLPKSSHSAPSAVTKRAPLPPVISIGAASRWATGSGVGVNERLTRPPGKLRRRPGRRSRPARR